MCVDGTGAGKNEEPFEACRKQCHHWRSTLIELFKQMRKYERWTPASNENNERRKIRSGLMTMAAWARWPVKDCSSFFEQDFLYRHRATRSVSVTSLFAGNRSSKRTESIRMPRNVSRAFCVIVGYQYAGNWEELLGSIQGAPSFLCSWGPQKKKTVKVV